METPKITPIKNCGIYVAGDFTATNVTSILNNPSAMATSQATGKLPFRFNIPTPTRHFSGRQDTMKAIRDHFDNLPGQVANCWERIVAIVGLGGMGKTETAYKFAAESKNKFPSAAWIDAETEQSALQSFLGLAKHLAIVSKDQINADLNLVYEVYRHINQEDYGSVLFIFDNAIRLNSDGDEFAIFEFLPTIELPNQQFPNILITTQTPDWGKTIKTFQVGGLNEKESIEFFCSSFKIKSMDCTKEFKKLHDVLEGYPLAMNLVASQVDYDPNKDSTHHLQQQIKGILEKIEKKPENILSEKMNRAWETKYNKTLSTVWQLTLERLQQESKGPEALELLTILSFLNNPMSSEDIVQILASSTDCPHPPNRDLQFRLKESIRILERFYTVRTMKVHFDNDEAFICNLGMHRLLQLMVRYQLDSTKAIQSVLSCLTHDSYSWKMKVNTTALETALHTNQLTPQSFPYVGILACDGLPAACKIVETRKPETKAEIVISRFYYLKRGMRTLNTNEILLLRELVGLTKSEKWKKDRQCFAYMTMQCLLNKWWFEHVRADGTKVPGYFDLENLHGIAELVAELISNVFSFDDLRCESGHCIFAAQKLHERVAALTAKLSEDIIRADSSKQTLAVRRLADLWLAVIGRLRYYHIGLHWGYPFFWSPFWVKMYETFNSPDASQLRIAELRTCLWNRGLAKALVQAFEVRTGGPYFLPSDFKECIELCLDEMNLSDKRVQKVVSAICETTMNLPYVLNLTVRTSGHDGIFILIEVCCIWIRILLLDDNDSGSGNIRQCLSRCIIQIGTWIQEAQQRGLITQINRVHLCRAPKNYTRRYFPQFIERYSSSEISEIKTLVNFCGVLMEIYNQ